MSCCAQAEHYLYIENQYFLGSSHCWDVDRHAGATHLVPIEIALKIVSKINDGERFMAYIVIPLFPEGAPNAALAEPAHRQAVPTVGHYRHRRWCLALALSHHACTHKSKSCDLWVTSGVACCLLH